MEGSQRPTEESHQRRRITPSIQPCIESIKEGQQPVIDLDVHPDMRQLQVNFLEKCKTVKMGQCMLCKERWWDLKIGKSQICARCEKEIKNRKFQIALMSRDNKMDPFPYEHHKHLPVLRQVEQALISRVQVVMKCYRLKDGGYGYKGHVMNFEQDPGHIFKVLPLDFKDVPIVILRRKNDKHPQNYKDFRVRREAIRSWLIFLRRHNVA